MIDRPIEYSNGNELADGNKRIGKQDKIFYCIVLITQTLHSIELY